MWLCTLSYQQLYDKCENAQWKKSNNCNQCDFSSSRAGDLTRHLTKHNGEKSNHCNQFNSQFKHLKTHLKTGSGEKPNKCSQCAFASSHIGDLRWHLNKTHFRRNKILNAASVTLHPPEQAIWGDIWQRTKEKIEEKNATIVTMHLPWQAFWGAI